MCWPWSPYLSLLGRQPMGYFDDAEAVAEGVYLVIELEADFFKGVSVHYASTLQWHMIK